MFNALLRNNWKVLGIDLDGIEGILEERDSLSLYYIY